MVPYSLKITDNIEEHAEYSVQQEQNLIAIKLYLSHQEIRRHIVKFQHQH